MDSVDAGDFIELGLSPSDAAEYIEDGIRPDQITRTDSGYDVRLERWQEDPADQLPKVIEAGRFGLTLWSPNPSSDEPLETDLSFEWDGKRTVKWSVTSGVGLSVMSDVFFSGLASWPDGKDVLLTYQGSDYLGDDQLKGAAPTASGPKGANDPQQWVQFAWCLVGLTEELLNSGGETPEEYASEYHCPADDEWLDFDDMFRTFLDTEATDSVLTSFHDWLIARLAAGTYEIP